MSHNGRKQVIHMNYQNERDELADDLDKSFPPQTANFQIPHESNFIEHEAAELQAQTLSNPLP